MRRLDKTSNDKMFPGQHNQAFRLKSSADGERFSAHIVSNDFDYSTFEVAELLSSG